jgi:hypothetical protein
MKNPSSGDRICVHCDRVPREGMQQSPSSGSPQAAQTTTVPQPGPEEASLFTDPSVFGPFAMAPAVQQPSQPQQPPSAGLAPSHTNGPLVPPHGAVPAGVDESRPWRRPPPQQQQQQQDEGIDVAEVIAQRMVQGWALLAQYCPRWAATFGFVWSLLH